METHSILAEIKANQLAMYKTSIILDVILIAKIENSMKYELVHALAIGHFRRIKFSLLGVDRDNTSRAQD